MILMSIHVYLYNCSADRCVLDKTAHLTPAAGLDLQGTIRGSIDVYAPEIDIERTITLSDYNYVQIPYFSRYYYITEATVIRTGLTRCRLECDPLMSFKDQILALPAIAVRTADRTQQSPYLIDHKIQFAAYKQIRTFNLGAFEGTTFKVMVTAG